MIDWETATGFLRCFGCWSMRKVIFIDQITAFTFIRLYHVNLVSLNEDRLPVLPAICIQPYLGPAQ